MKGLSEKIKTDKRFKKQFIACVSAAAVIVVCAVAVPVGVHSSNVKKAETAAEEASRAAELTTDEETTAEETTEALTEEAATVEETTAETTAASADTVKSTTKSSTTKASATKANTTKAGTTKAAATAAAAETTTQSSGHQWTQAEVDAVVAEIKQYGINKGLSVDSSLGIQGTTWANPVHTGANKEKTISDLKYDVDERYNAIMNKFGYIPEGATFNVFSKPVTENEWEIYFVV